jgi:hypothetical protein
MSGQRFFLGYFNVPSDRVKELKEVERPYITPLDTICEEGELTDWIYDGASLHVRSMFDESRYVERVALIREILAHVIGHGGEGRGTIIAFGDESDDDDVDTSTLSVFVTVFGIQDGRTIQTLLMSPDAVAAIRATSGYQALLARVARATEN